MGVTYTYVESMAFVPQKNKTGFAGSKRVAAAGMRRFAQVSVAVSESTDLQGGAEISDQEIGWNRPRGTRLGECGIEKRTARDA